MAGMDEGSGPRGADADALEIYELSEAKRG
jgi:hypothetical protein